MAEFATTEDLAAATGEDGNDQGFVGRAALAIQLASAAIQRYTDQTLDHVADEVIVLRGNCYLLALPQKPVTSLTVTLDGEAFTEWELDSAGLLYRTDGLAWPRLVTVTYTHGYDEIPDDIRRVCVQVAARMMANPSGMRSEQIDDYAYTVADASHVGAQLTEEERGDLTAHMVLAKSTRVVLSGAEE